MTLDALIMLAGFFTAVLPFLGFPIQWDNIILVVLGALIIALGIVVRRSHSPRAAGAPKEEEALVESAKLHEEQRG